MTENEIKEEEVVEVSECFWKYIDYGIYSTSCGERMYVNRLTMEQSRIILCPSCEKMIVEEK